LVSEAGRIVRETCTRTASPLATSVGESF
jgi:hypothetical protein